MERCLRVLSFFLLISSLWLLSGCNGGDNKEDGDQSTCTPECGEGLVCSNGSCICPINQGDDDELCCVSGQDCPLGWACDPRNHRCITSCVDCDDEITDGDDVPDGDVEEPDGDTDELPDGDPTETDGDDTDGDLAETDGDLLETDDDADWDNPAETDIEESSQDGYQYGIDELLHAEKLPYFRRGVVRQFSSHDPTGGISNCSMTNLYYYNGESVLMDVKGPGCLYRFWLDRGASFSRIDGHSLKFYFDEESSASVNMQVSSFFMGDTSPFLSPLVGYYGNTSNGGYYSTLPMCFKTGLRVTLTGTPQCYDFTYHTFPDDDGIETFTMSTDVSEVVDFYTNHLGEDPKPTDNNTKWSDNREIKKGQTSTPFEDPQARLINAIKVKMIPSDDPEMLKKVYLEMYWENKTNPDVSVPIGLFFGTGFGSEDAKSLLLGKLSDGYWYSYFPMPYWMGAKIKVRNDSEVDISEFRLELQLAPNPYPMNIGHFQAHYEEELPTETDTDFRALDSVGRGQVVGITLAMESGEIYTKDFIRGHERFYVDELNSPSLIGTSMDAYFNGGNNWANGSYSTPLFSMWTNNGFPTFQYTARRLMPGDALTFNRAIRMGFKHGADNTVNANYRSVVYSYRSCLEGLSVATEEGSLDFMDLTQEELHHLSLSYAGTLDNIKGQYEGVMDEVDVYDSGRRIGGNPSLSAYGYIEFDLGIDSRNNGIRLVRMLDYSAANQNALVYVDGEPVGYWYTPGQNSSSKRWKDDIFDIPKDFTSGKSNIRLKFEWVKGYGEFWNIFKLWSYSLLPPSATDGPGQVSLASMSYEMVGLQPKISWAVPAGTPPELYHVYRSDKKVFDCSEVTFVKSVDKTTFRESSDLLAQKDYYYRVQAEDCTGTRGVCSEVFLVKTGLPPFCFEAEDAVRADLSTANITIREIAASGFGNNKFVQFEATGDNQNLALLPSIPYSGTYEIIVYAAQEKDYGQWQLRLSGNPQGNIQEGYTPSDTPVPTGEINLGQNYISLTDTQGNPKENIFRFVTRGKAAASIGRFIGIDKVCLNGVTTE